MLRNRRLLVAILPAALALALGAAAAQANFTTSATYTLGYTGLPGNQSTYVGPYVNVTVSASDTNSDGFVDTATFTYDSLRVGNFIFLLGGGPSQAGANLAGTVPPLGNYTGLSATTDWTVGSGSALYKGGASTLFTPVASLSAPPGTDQFNGFGDYNSAVQTGSGYDDAASEIKFTVAAATGTHWGTTAASVLLDNAEGYSLAAHVAVCNVTGTVTQNGVTHTICSDTAPATFDVVGSAQGDVPVPIPAAAWLFGSGLVGLVGIARRKANGASLPREIVAA